MGAQDLDERELAMVSGGFAARDLASTLDNFDHSVASSLSNLPGTVADGIHHAYLSAVSYPTAAIGGWKLAGKMFGSSTTMADRYAAMGQVRQLVMESDTIPSAFRFGF